VGQPLNEVVPPALTVEIVEMAEEHIPCMQAIERESFPVIWPCDSFERELNHNRVARYLVALVEGSVVGYIGSWIILDEVHITTMAVSPSVRNRGVGRRLMARLMRGSHRPRSPLGPCSRCARATNLPCVCISLRFQAGRRAPPVL